MRALTVESPFIGFFNGEYNEIGIASRFVELADKGVVDSSVVFGIGGWCATSICYAMLLNYDAVAEAARELNTTIEGYVKSIIDKVREVVPEDVPLAIDAEKKSTKISN